MKTARARKPTHAPSRPRPLQPFPITDVYLFGGVG
jgi:hypothetical protein